VTCSEVVTAAAVTIKQAPSHALYSFANLLLIITRTLV